MQKLNFSVKLLLPFVTLALLSGCQKGKDPYAGTAALQEQPLPFDMSILEDADRSVYLSSDPGSVLKYEFRWIFEFNNDNESFGTINQLIEDINNTGFELIRHSYHGNSSFILTKDSENELWAFVPSLTKEISHDYDGMSIIISTQTNDKRFRESKSSFNDFYAKKRSNE